MKRKDIIRRILGLTAWLLVMAGITTLLVAANKKQKGHLCQDLVIGMRGSNGMYIEKNDILKLIERTHGRILNKPLVNINISRLERNLELSPWVKDAELYFDNKDVLHVFIEERQPIARIFTSSGRSFYIDSSGHAMPLLEKMSARVPVVTGFPAGSRWYAQDSALMNEVRIVASYIYHNQFWNAQVGQIDITDERNYELIPVIGNHVIKIGKSDRIEEKLKRLYVFYKQVLSKTGFDKYAALNVQYEGQVVAVKRMPVSPVDSVQLQKNVEELMARAMAQVGDEGMLPDQYNNIKKDSAVSSMTAKANHVSTKTIPNPIRTPINSNPAKTKQSGSTEKPKAVMRRNE